MSEQLSPSQVESPIDSDNRDQELGDLVLRLVSEPHNGQIIRLSGRKCTIGSAPGCTLCLRSGYVSSVHCMIVRGQQQTMLRNMVNDTKLNGSTFEFEAINEGDRIAIGPVELEVVSLSSTQDDSGAGEASTAEPEAHIVKNEAEPEPNFAPAETEPESEFAPNDETQESNCSQVEGEPGAVNGEQVEHAEEVVHVEEVQKVQAVEQLQQVEQTESPIEPASTPDNQAIQELSAEVDNLKRTKQSIRARTRRLVSDLREAREQIIEQQDQLIEQKKLLQQGQVQGIEFAERLDYLENMLAQWQFGEMPQGLFQSQENVDQTQILDGEQTKTRRRVSDTAPLAEEPAGNDKNASAVAKQAPPVQSQSHEQDANQPEQPTNPLAARPGQVMPSGLNVPESLLEEFGEENEADSNATEEANAEFAESPSSDTDEIVVKPAVFEEINSATGIVGHEVPSQSVSNGSEMEHETDTPLEFRSAETLMEMPPGSNTMSYEELQATCLAAAGDCSPPEFDATAQPTPADEIQVPEFPVSNDPEGLISTEPNSFANELENTSEPSIQSDANPDGNVESIHEVGATFNPAWDEQGEQDQSVEVVDELNHTEDIAGEDGNDGCDSAALQADLAGLIKRVRAESNDKSSSPSIVEPSLDFDLEAELSPDAEAPNQEVHAEESKPVETHASDATPSFEAVSNPGDASEAIANTDLSEPSPELDVTTELSSDDATDVSPSILSDTDVFMSQSDTDAIDAESIAIAANNELGQESVPGVDKTNPIQSTPNTESEPSMGSAGERESEIEAGQDETPLVAEAVAEAEIELEDETEFPESRGGFEIEPQLQTPEPEPEVSIVEEVAVESLAQFEEGEEEAAFVVPTSQLPPDADSEDSEESIEEYMAKLLQRVRGGSEADAAAMAASVIKPPESMCGPKPDAAAESKTADEASLLKEAFAEEIQSREEELAPATSTKKTEVVVKRGDLDAMRVLANSSARSAIRESQQRKETQLAYAQLAGAVGAVLLGAAMIGMSESILSFVFFGALGLWGLAGILGYRTYTWYRANILKQMQANNTNGEAVQVDEDGNEIPVELLESQSAFSGEAQNEPPAAPSGLQGLKERALGLFQKNQSVNVEEVKTLDLPAGPQNPEGDNQSPHSPEGDTNPEA